MVIYETIQRLNQSLQNIYNLHKSSFCTKGSTESVRSNTEERHELWSRLAKLYGNKAKHVDALMGAIKNFPKYAEDVTKISITERAHENLLPWRS